MKKLIALQKLDLKIEALRELEREIPKQKHKYEIHRKRLAQELEESERRCKKLVLEQRECEGEIEQKQAQIRKYDGQLLAVKKNEEYQALLHEMDVLRKQIGVKEERIIGLMVEQDEAKVQLEEDKKRIQAELNTIDEECKKIDVELQEAVRDRKELEAQRQPIEAETDRELVSKYARIRKAKKTGPAAVPLNDEYCSGCNMKVTPQIVNEILEGSKVHTCSHCGRLLFFAENLESAAAE